MALAAGRHREQSTCIIREPQCPQQVVCQKAEWPHSEDVFMNLVVRISLRGVGSEPVHNVNDNVDLGIVKRLCLEEVILDDLWRDQGRAVGFVK